MYALQQEPPYDTWREYTLPLLCRERIEEVCKDILKRGENTRYAKIYDAIVELVEDAILTEDIEGNA